MEQRRSTRSKSRTDLTDSQRRRAEAEHWNAQEDPLQIERNAGRSEALRLTKQHTTVQQSIINTTRNINVPPLTYTTPETSETSHVSQREVTQGTAGTMSEGTISPDNNTARVNPEAESIFFDDDISDVMRASTQANQTGNRSWNDPLGLDPMNHDPNQQKWMSLSWVIPDGLNRKIEEVEEKSIANFASPGGGEGAMILQLPALAPYYNTDTFLADLTTGELFAQVRSMWYATGLTCGNRQFSPNEVDERVQRESEKFKMKLTEEEQTEVVQTRQDATQYLNLPTPTIVHNTPPLPLPNFPNPRSFYRHPDVMELHLRKEYLKDRRIAASKYILEYAQTSVMVNEGVYTKEQLTQRLRTVFGRANEVREKIDDSLANDDYHRRIREMRVLGTPRRFPDPSSMRNTPPNEWIKWVNSESEKLCEELEEEILRVRQGNDPFDGTAGGVFKALPHEIPSLNSMDQAITSLLNYPLIPFEPGLETVTTPTSNTSRVQRQLIPNMGTPENQQEEQLANRLITTPEQYTVGKVHNSPIESGGTGGQPPRVTTPTVQQQAEVSPPQAPNTTINRETTEISQVSDTSNRAGDEQPPTPAEPAVPQQDTNAANRRQSQQDTSKISQVSVNQNQMNPGQSQVPVEPVGPQQDIKTSVHNQPQQGQHESNRPLPEEKMTHVCTRCGYEGHTKYYCRESVYCNLCNQHTHNTKVCMKYGNFVKAKPVASSRRTTPVNEGPRYSQREQIQYQSQDYREDIRRTQGVAAENLQYDTYGQFQHRFPQPGTFPQQNAQPQTNFRPRFPQSHPTNRMQSQPYRYPQYNQQQAPQYRMPAPQQVQQQYRMPAPQIQTQAQVQHYQQGLPAQVKTQLNENSTIHQQQQDHGVNRNAMTEGGIYRNATGDHPIQGGPEMTHPKVPQNYQTSNLQGITVDLATLLQDSNRPIYVNYYYGKPTNSKDGDLNPERSEISQVSGSKPNVPSVMNKAPQTTTNNSTSEKMIVVQPVESFTTNTIPDLQTAPPPIHKAMETKPELKPEVNESNNELMNIVKGITDSLQKHLSLNAKQAEYNTKQNTKLMEELIKSQSRRDLDPALLAIPTFTGLEPEKCLDWIQRVKNVCSQSGRSLRQELINKSELPVQNFIQSLDTLMPDTNLVDRVMEYFSDIQTSTQAIAKLRNLYQGQDESILMFNQKFKAVLERIDLGSVENIRSDLQINMYLESIKPSISKSIKGNRFYGNKYAPSTLGEAMKKAEECHLKDVYVRGGWNDDWQDTRAEQEVTIQTMETENRGGWRKPYQSNNYTPRGRDRDTSEISHASRLPRGTYTQIMVNPMQLDDRAFTAWIERLVEAKKNRHNNVRRPYRNFRKPYNEQQNDTEGDSYHKPQLKQFLKPAPELNVDEIQKYYQCTYEDIEEAVDMYNLDVEECRRT